METARLFKLVCVICIASLIPTIRANVADETDEYWVNKANEARKHTLMAYHPDPYEIVDHFHERHYDNSTDVEGTEEEKAVASEEEDVIEMISSPTNSTRRSLTGRGKGKGKGKWSKLTGPCTASNPIDKCWRCQPDWARRRKKLVHCVRGFGYRTTGGKRGRIYVVTSPRDDDMVNPRPGTLRHAVIQKEPLWIVFKHDMSIRLSQELMITSDKTIDARGANVHIAYGAGITMQYVHNIIIHGLHVHHIVKSSGGLIRDSINHFGHRGEADGDGISIFGATNIWLDHISMSKCQDGLIDAIMGSTAITISNSHFTHHNDVMLLGAQNNNMDDKKMQVTVAYNHFGKGLVQRMPRVRWGFVHVVNNDYTHWELYAIGGSQGPTILSHGNRFIAPPHKQHYREVTKRDYASESEWKNWNWRSEKDVFMNNAYFRQSGNPHFKCSHSRQQMIKPKNGMAVSKLTKYAGALDCRVGKAC
ncbi:putative pectate lyase [Arabidopsis thaliana]|uniref:Probable pectate lyase 7 n=4 Tax=Arabidopsis TaxID=3701 RepID=PLY7_ARATH|nr:Pectate lyase family protein [Arabidopsis thaliana]Q9SRH4.1 RecName: Full=Probable pectate lyase 7; Flags: Precursor [Arabidopsis thaliana]KAG7629593.1 Pectate lyase [Arabidopsis suecica]AAF03499.1 putative pectate lyase [Arabidopsis thaliana]AAF26147.1 putative pectate lyase [Arabidopsis thaliana]ABI93918.1 At3g01270 [Arabidopsis thaliana]AEE73631.1 Pectate lyase family protein [Arabidopsis thaliana]|eukprot:NP_186776.1 Pectate lyase family protein [Arabidopsis thaliana]